MVKTADPTKGTVKCHACGQDVGLDEDGMIARHRSRGEGAGFCYAASQPPQQQDDLIDK